jgi:predicted transposase YdaD
MKTDTLFYELFQAAPQTFFELLQITPPCPYRFESITVKTSEKRIDGVLEPSEEGEPIYFVEVQATSDEVIYWRTMREVATFFEQRPKLKDNDWQAIVLWLNRSDDPTFGTLSLLAQSPLPRLVSADFPALLKQLDESSLAFNVLRPLIVETEQEVRQNVSRWVETIRTTSDLDQQAEERLITVLSQLIEQKFKTLTYKELSKMLRLTPLRETESFKEAIKEDRIETLATLIQSKFALSDEVMEAITADLQNLSLEDLRALVEQILKLETFEQLETWIADHLPAAEA